MDDALRSRIRSYIDDLAAEQLQFVIDLCRQNSYTYNPPGTNLVAEMLLGRIEDLFPRKKTVRQHEVGNHHILQTRREANSVHILGHMDTVFPPDHSFQECTIDGEWLIGPGAGDMKGGLAVIVYAMKTLDHCGILDRMNITLILSADEEIGAVTSCSIYERERRNATACLVAECAGPSGEVVLSRNGKAGLRLDCFGEDQHVAAVSTGKKSAILEMAHKVLALESLSGSLPGVAVNVGKIEGGLGPCTVPVEASCLVDIRWAEEKYYDAVLGRIRDIAKEPACQGCGCNLSTLNHRPAMPLTPQTEKLFEALERVARSAGMKIGTEHRRGTSDANFFGSAGIPTIDGLGPICLHDHTPKERIHIPSMSARTTLLALLLADMDPNWAPVS